MLKPCSNGGCPYLTQERYCSSCVSKGIIHVKTESRVRFDAMYNTAEWRRYSTERRAKYPLCCDRYGRHEGILIATAVTDHIIPHRGDRRLFWDPKNHQSLCAECHNWKSNRERYNLDPTIHTERVVGVSVSSEGGIITDPTRVRKIG